MDLLNAAAGAAARLRMVIPPGYIDATDDVYANLFFERCGISSGSALPVVVDENDFIAAMESTDIAVVDGPVPCTSTSSTSGGPDLEIDEE